MTDANHAAGPGGKPRRAEPLQPDRPGRGDETEPSADDDGGQVTDDSATGGSRTAEQQERIDTALENVREGYD